MTSTMQQPYSWKERLKDSSWVTVAWDWFMTLLGRVVEAALWVTMVFSCYQLIPGAPQPAPAIGDLMFIIQFVSLDIGGIGLNKLAQSQELGKWSYPRIIAYILIGLTLVTVAYAGLQHVVTSIPPQVTNGIEVSLVVARSVMTVLYGQAVHSLKHEIRTTERTMVELEQQLSSLSVQLDTEQQRVSTLDVQASSLRVQLDSKAQEVESLRDCLHSAALEVSSLRQALDAKEQEASSLRVQVSSRRQQTGHDAALDSGQGRVSSGERVIVLDKRRTAKRTASGESDQHDLIRRVQEVLDNEPWLSGRAIAARLGCSPTTASKWKTHLEQRQQRTGVSGHS